MPYSAGTHLDLPRNAKVYPSLSRVPGQRSENHELLHVKSDYVRGLWDANHRGPAVVTVRAINAEEAAMPLCGPLRKRGKPCEYRAQV